MQHHIKPVPFAVQNFDALPDTARVPGPVVDLLFSISRCTRWRRIPAGQLPAPRREVGSFPTFSVGEIRAALAARV